MKSIIAIMLLLVVSTFGLERCHDEIGGADCHSTRCKYGGVVSCYNTVCGCLVRHVEGCHDNLSGSDCYSTHCDRGKLTCIGGKCSCLYHPY